MIILDTNVFSALMQDTPAPIVIAWLDRQPSQSIWTTATTIFEVQVGIALLPGGRRRDRLETAFARALDEVLAHRILPFDESAARHAGIVGARRRRDGLNVDFHDTQIAGIALARRAAIATRNVRHFADLDLVLFNPWDGPATR